MAHLTIIVGTIAETIIPLLIPTTAEMVSIFQSLIQIQRVAGGIGLILLVRVFVRNNLTNIKFYYLCSVDTVERATGIERP